MARPPRTLLPPLLVRLALRLRLCAYWSLVGAFCALCGAAALLRLCWSAIARPSATFRWTPREAPPACLHDTSLGTHCYVRIKDSGLRFHYVAAGERGKPLMLFLHGFPEFWFSWRYQLREFKSEFRVVAVDMRGYGESDLPLAVDCYRPELLLADVKDIVEHLGYNRCFLVGHDWGGTIAWLFAINYPEMVAKLIVLNCPHPSVHAGPEGLVHQPQHRNGPEWKMADGGGAGSVPVRAVAAWSFDGCAQLLQKCFQLSAVEPQPGAVAGAAAVGRARRLRRAGDGGGVPGAHPQPLPPQCHLGGQPLAAAGPARHRQHAHVDLPQGGRRAQGSQELTDAGRAMTPVVRFEAHTEQRTHDTVLHLPLRNHPDIVMLATPQCRARVHPGRKHEDRRPP
ncbi:dihydrolipoyllysine-residue acetyltransferase component of acetoin cleaving system isoform X1 [Syngnathoides biaculeatus]|uniref:dihydrolipoyllysine-residue acetyltransferase component of acetoin cleaving system isoform X1 n=1 Tax=Syngnathoides biaculeatus TaxID=300417 RepID=UPI002ADE87D4|nr:dihydrolipoyllysine-residue acetyltransferase component of acetoin cleaving system isoform X1 [Syngnathoides biaculeatus]